MPRSSTGRAISVWLSFDAFDALTQRADSLAESVSACGARLIAGALDVDIPTLIAERNSLQAQLATAAPDLAATRSERDVAVARIAELDDEAIRWERVVEEYAKRLAAYQREDVTGIKGIVSALRELLGGDRSARQRLSDRWTSLRPYERKDGLDAVLRELLIALDPRTVSEMLPPGAGEVTALRARIGDLSGVCSVAEAIVRPTDDWLLNDFIDRWDAVEDRLHRLRQFLARVEGRS